MYSEVAVIANGKFIFNYCLYFQKLLVNKTLMRVNRYGFDIILIVYACFIFSLLCLTIANEMFRSTSFSVCRHQSQ